MQQSGLLFGFGLGRRSLIRLRYGVRPWAALAAATWLAACENPQPPGPCGSIPQQSITVGQTATVNVCFEDPNGDMLNYTVATSSPRVATASTSGGTVTVTAVSPGIAIVTVTASDPGGLNAQLKFQVMVPNRAPVVIGALADQTVNLGDTATLDLSAVFSDPDGEALTYGAMASDASVAAVSAPGAIAMIAARRKGETTVTVTATDPGGLTAGCPWVRPQSSIRSRRSSTATMSGQDRSSWLTATGGWCG